MNPKQSIRSMSQCQCTPLNFSCSLLLKLPMLEDNSSAYLNFLVCQSMPWPLPTYSLFFFFTSSKNISGINYGFLAGIFTYR